MSCGEIWRVESRDRTTSVVIADDKEEPDSELPNERNYEGVTSLRQILATKTGQALKV